MPQFQVFHVPPEGGLALDDLNTFMRSHRVLKVDRTAFPDGWMFCVEWLEGAGSHPGDGGASRAPRVDYMKELPPEIFRRFSRLRDVRRDLALRQAVDRYIIATDAQLAELAKMKEPSKTALLKIPGFGPGRFERCGEDLLAAARAILTEEKPGSGPEEPTQSTESDNVPF